MSLKYDLMIKRITIVYKWYLRVNDVLTQDIARRNLIGCHVRDTRNVKEIFGFHINELGDLDNRGMLIKCSRIVDYHGMFLCSHELCCFDTT